MARPKSMQPTDQVTLTVKQADCLKLLHRAFVGSRDCWVALAIQAKTTALNAEKARDTREAARHTARVTEYQRRAARVQAFIDELPPLDQE